jgi:hypothetical protein
MRDKSISLLFLQIISLSEFRMGCKILNDNLPADSQLVNIDETLKLMDFDGSGSIDINEFFEVRCMYVWIDG